MGKSIKEKMLDLMNGQEVERVNFFNDGSVTTDNYSFVEHSYFSTAAIGKTFYDAAESYFYRCDFDNISMDLLLGLVYDKKYVNDDNSLKENAKPMDNIVRYYTGSVKSYLDNVQTNTEDYYKYGVGRQGYVKYDDLLSMVEREGLAFTGPKTFEEFRDLILCKCKFDVRISANLKQEKQKKLIK